MRCTIETRDFGTMVFTLYPEYAPLTVANFVKTARSGFYDGLCWCRIVKDYVIQGGSPDNDIMTDSDWHIKGEFTENGVNNPLKHIRGALSMARDDDFDPAGTQFFVVHKDAAKLDGRYDVIATGSLLGIKGYNQNPASIPVGYETVMEMYPLDFEEFLWANGINEAIIDSLQSCLINEKPVPSALHHRMQELLLQYAVVGGMPAAVNAFIETKQLNLVLSIQRNIIASYEDDMVKYAENKDKPLIKACFQSIPKQLSKENKKFQYSLIKKGSTAARFAGSLQWVEDAGIIKRCYNLSLPELPLDGNSLNDIFKVYMQDTGLFVSMLEDGTQFDILQGNLYGYKGAIFENLAADIFSKMGRKLYYYHKNSGLEIDFVIRYKGQATLIEVKANSGNVKSCKTILRHPEKYHVKQAIKLGTYNIGRPDESFPILTIPFYMCFLLREY